MSKLSFIQDWHELYLVAGILSIFIFKSKIKQIEFNNRYDKEYYKYSGYDKIMYVLYYAPILFSNVVIIHAGFGTIKNIFALH